MLLLHVVYSTSSLAHKKYDCKKTSRKQACYVRKMYETAKPGSAGRNLEKSYTRARFLASSKEETQPEPASGFLMSGPVPLTMSCSINVVGNKIKSIFDRIRQAVM